MSRTGRSLPDGFGGSQGDTTTASTGSALDEPYGPRALGATTDPLEGATAAPPAAGEAGLDPGWDAIVASAAPPPSSLRRMIHRRAVEAAAEEDEPAGPDEAGELFAGAVAGGGGEVPYRGEMEAAFGEPFGDVRA